MGAEARIIWSVVQVTTRTYVHSGMERLIEQPSQGTDTVYSRASFTLPSNIENLILEGTANLNGTGNELGNILIGNSGNNVPNGVAGADTMIGGLGNDIYYVDQQGDVVIENAGEGTDTVYAYCDYTMPANVEILNLYGLAIRGAINAGGNS